MSESKRKAERKKMDLVAGEAKPQEVAEEMARSIAKMYEDRDKKAVSAKEHLISQLEVTVDKYRTANGVMSALDTVRLVYGRGYLEIDDELAVAKSVAKVAAGVAQAMAKKAGQLDPEEMDQLCDGFYQKEFADGDADARDLVDELMSLQLCQNVGPNAEDITEFVRHADEEIEKARNDLREHCEKNGLDFDELCGPHDRCPDCLCMDCAKDCKEGRQIVEGQSAYDVCEDFVEAGE